MSAEGKAVEFKNVLSKGVEAFAAIGGKIRLKKDEDKPKLARVLAILMNSFGARNVSSDTANYIKDVLGIEPGSIAVGECPQVRDRSVCYNANHVLAIALSIAYLRVKERG